MTEVTQVEEDATVEKLNKALRKETPEEKILKRCQTLEAKIKNLEVELNNVKLENLKVQHERIGVVEALKIVTGK